MEQFLLGDYDILKCTLTTMLMVHANLFPCTELSLPHTDCIPCFSDSWDTLDIILSRDNSAGLRRLQGNPSL